MADDKGITPPCAGAMDKLRRQGMAHEAFREGYNTRDGLIRLGDMLRRAREASGLTQEMLASKIGMEQPAVSRLESGFGPHGPEIDTVRRFVHGCEAELVISVKAKPGSERRQHDVAAMAFETSL